MTAADTMQIAVSVATLWTNPSSPRPMDAPALGNPVDLRAWFDPMTVDDRRDLCDGSRAQTQALYGAAAVVLRRAGSWAEVALPDQSCRKDARGYPGWLPIAQLLPATNTPDAQGRSIVAQPRAWLHTLAQEPVLELSYATELVTECIDSAWVRAATPHGPRLLRRADVAVSCESPPGAALGRLLVEDCRRFLGLAYLWAGISAFGFDCSGLVYSVHRRYGIRIPRDAAEQAAAGLLVANDALEPGDLLFFAHDHGTGRVHHVAMYAGDGQMIHSPRSGRNVELEALRGHELEAEHVVSRRYW